MPDSILDLATAAYDAGLDASLWPGVLKRLNVRLRASGAVLAFVGRDGALAGYRAHGPDPSHLDSYATHYRHQDRVARAVMAGPPGKIWHDEMVRTKADLWRTEFHADWCRPADLEHSMQAVAYHTLGQRALLAIGRPARRRAFDDEETRMLGAVLPHLGRAVAVHVRLAGARLAERSARLVLDHLAYAVFLADARGAVTDLNEAARALLGRHTGLTLRAGRLDAAIPGQCTALRRALVQAATRPPRGGWLALDRADGGPRLRCMITPASAETAERLGLGDVAALLLIDAGALVGGRQAALCELFDLTRAEAAVAEAALTGEGVPAIAERLGVAPTTVRTHLRRVYEKTGVRGQAELGVVLARLPVTVGRRGAV